MNILFYLCLVFAVSLALAKIPDEEIKTRQFMTDSDEGHSDGVEYEDEESDEDAFGVEPTKHPYKQCLEVYHECVQNSCKIWERQKECLLQFYRCQNEYTGKCRELYKSSACYNLLGRDTCRKKLIQCYGSDSEFLFGDDTEGVDPDRHPYVQCKIDLYDCFKAGTGKLECLKKYKSCMSVLIPTVPPFVTACNNELKQCLKEAPWLLGKGQCFVKYGKCLINKGPVSEAVRDMANDGEPDRHPYVQCKIDLYDCVKAGKEKLECLKGYKTCMAVLIPTLPPFVVTCKNNLKQCLNGVSGLKDKAQCFVDFGKCLVNKGPKEAVMDVAEDGEPDRHPYVQCKIDLYDCVRAGLKGKLECLKDYKSCMAVLIPTIPPFVVACSNDLKQCVKDSPGFVNKTKCLRTYYKCLRNKGPAEVALDAIEDMGQLEDVNGFAQCQKNFYQCYKDEKDKKKCASEYKTCMEALIPAYVKQCYAKAKECFASASGIKEKYACAKQLGICLKNGASS